jgi:hypothetical protein
MSRARSSSLRIAFAIALGFLSRPHPASAQPAPSVPDGGLSLWQHFLTRYVDTTAADRINRIRYASVTPEDRDGLESFISAQQSVKVSALGRAQQKAYWINLYNAKIVAVALSRYPLQSIMDVKLGDGNGKKAGPFDAKLLVVEGDSLSLDDIENKILHQGWTDNRIHFALNCASLGCPNLSAEAFTADNIDRLMNKGSHAFLTSPRGATFQGKTLQLSSIFTWYKEDFGKNDAVVLCILANYSDPKLKSRLQTYAGKITYQYDWKLNDASVR